MLAEWLPIAIGLAAFLFAVPYLLGPLVVYVMLRFQMPPNVVPIDPSSQPLPDEARQYLGVAYQQLTAEGYQYLATVLLPDMANVRTLFGLYARPASSDLAMATIMVTDNPMGDQLKTRYVEFVRRYDDGVVVMTNNSAELSSFPAQPHHHTSRFWDVTDIVQLHQLHQALAARLCRLGRPINRLESEYAGNVVRFVAEAVLEETFRNQLTTGYLSVDASGYRPTIKGALLMAWKEAWPIKQLRRRHERHKAIRLLQELAPSLGKPPPA